MACRPRTALGCPGRAAQLEEGSRVGARVRFGGYCLTAPSMVFGAFVPISIHFGFASSGLRTCTFKTPSVYDAVMASSETPFGSPTLRAKVPKRRSSRW